MTRLPSVNATAVDMARWLHSLHTFLHAIFYPFLMRAGFPARRILRCKSSEVSATATVVVTACEDRLIAVNGSCPDGAVLQAVVQGIHLVIKALLEQRCLSVVVGKELSSLLNLGSLSAGVHKLLSEVGDCVVLLGVAIVAKLILDGLDAAIDRVHNGVCVAHVLHGYVLQRIAYRCTVRARFRRHGIAKISNTGIYAIESLHVCGLFRKGSVKVCNLVRVKLLRNCILSAGDRRRGSCKSVAKGLLNACEAVRHAHLNIAAASAELSRKSAHAVSDRGNGVMKLCVAEVLSIFAPRVILDLQEEGRRDTFAFCEGTPPFLC